jgi:hypothetical protein
VIDDVAGLAVVHVDDLVKRQPGAGRLDLDVGDRRVRELPQESPPDLRRRDLEPGQVRRPLLLGGGG